MPSQKEKDRRVSAAEKRLSEATEKARKFRLKAGEAQDQADKAERDLEWLRGMPVDDEPDDGTPPADVPDHALGEDPGPGL